MLETNYLEYPASIQEAMGIKVDWAEEAISQSEEQEEEPKTEISEPTETVAEQEEIPETPVEEQPEEPK